MVNPYFTIFSILRKKIDKLPLLYKMKNKFKGAVHVAISRHRST